MRILAALAAILCGLATVAGGADDVNRRAWTKEEIIAPIPPTAACGSEAGLVASSEFDLTGRGSILVTAHAAKSWRCRPDVLRIWRREADGYHVVLRSDEGASAARYAFTMTIVAEQRLLLVSRIADDAYHFDRFFVVGDDATLTAVSFAPPEAGCGSWLPSIGREEYAGLEIRADGDTVRFGFGAVDLRSRDSESREETSWRGTLTLTPSSHGTPQLRVAACQAGP